MSYLHKIKYEFLTLNHPPHSYFLVFNKNGFIKSCPSFEDLSAYEISWPHIDWCKFYIYLGIWNVCCFGMVEATGLKSMVSGSPSMEYPY
jgi:hypothetical protein